MTFEDAACLNSERYPWKRERCPGLIFAPVEITESKSSCWWNPFEGQQVMAELRVKNKKIENVMPVRFIGKYYIQGRSIDPQAVIFL